jgi:hypothetical protein
MLLTCDGNKEIYGTLPGYLNILIVTIPIIIRNYFLLLLEAECCQPETSSATEENSLSVYVTELQRLTALIFDFFNDSIGGSLDLALRESRCHSTQNCSLKVRHDQLWCRPVTDLLFHYAYHVVDYFFIQRLLLGGH